MQRAPGNCRGPEQAEQSRQGHRRREQYGQQGTVADPPAVRGGNGGEVVGVAGGLFRQRVGAGEAVAGVVGAQRLNQGTPVRPDLTARRLQPFHDGAPDPAGARGVASSADDRGRPAQPGKGCQQLGETVPRVLDGNAQDEFEEAAQEGAGSVQRDFPAGRVLEPQMDLCLAGGGRVAQGMGAVRDVEHPCAGDHHNAVPGQAVAPAEVDVVAASGKCRVKAAELLPDVAADQHAGGIDRKGIAAAVILALVEFVGVYQRQALGPAARGEADVDQPPLGMPIQLFAACHRDRRRALDGVEQFGEGLRRRCGVVVQQPDPVGDRCAAGVTVPDAGSVRSACGLGSAGAAHSVRRPRREGLEPCHDRAAHAGLGLVEDGDVGRAQCLLEEGRGVVAGTGVDTNDGVGRPRLGRQRREGPGEKITAVVGDHDGGDSYFLKN